MGPEPKAGATREPDHLLPRSGIVPAIAPPFSSRVVGTTFRLLAPKISAPGPGRWIVPFALASACLFAAVTRFTDFAPLIAAFAINILHLEALSAMYALL